MNEEVIAALIGALGSIVGSIISALATIAAVWAKKVSRPSCGLFFTIALLGGVLGFLAGFIPTLFLFSLYPNSAFTSPAIQGAPSTKPPTGTAMTPSPPAPTFSPISTPTMGVIPFTPTLPPPDINNLVMNGSFTEGFTGWERILIDQGGHSETKIVSFQSGRYGRALALYHSGPGGVYFRQFIDVPHSRLDFYSTFKSKVTSSLFGRPSGIAEIILVYLDAQGNELGRTRLINLPGGIFTDVPCIGCPSSPRDSNTEKFILIKNGHLYIDYHIDIYAHLTQELLGVPPDKVKKIAILLAVGTTAKKSTSLEAQLLVTDLRLYLQK